MFRRFWEWLKRFVQGDTFERAAWTAIQIAAAFGVYAWSDDPRLGFAVGVAASVVKNEVRRKFGSEILIDAPTPIEPEQVIAEQVDLAVNEAIDSKIIPILDEIKAALVKKTSTTRTRSTK